MIGAFRVLRACPNGTFAFAAMDYVASTEHVADGGVCAMFGVPVLAGGAGVIGIGAVSVCPAVVETDAVAGLVDRFGCFGGVGAGVVAVPSLGTGDGSEALFVGFRHVGIEVRPRFFCCRAGSPFLEGIGEDTAVF